MVGRVGLVPVALGSALGWWVLLGWPSRVGLRPTATRPQGPPPNPDHCRFVSRIVVVVLLCRPVLGTLPLPLPARSRPCGLLRLLVVRWRTLRWPSIHAAGRTLLASRLACPRHAPRPSGPPACVPRSVLPPVLARWGRLMDQAAYSPHRHPAMLAPPRTGGPPPTAGHDQATPQRVRRRAVAAPVRSAPPVPP